MITVKYQDHDGGKWHDFIKLPSTNKDKACAEEIATKLAAHFGIKAIVSSDKEWERAE